MELPDARLIEPRSSDAFVPDLYRVEAVRRELTDTVTLELTPDQTKVLAVAQQMADRLSLALRSVADAQEQDTSAADYLLSGDNGSAIIQVIKSGAIVTDAGAAPKAE
jgi:Flp pilus assembly protein CpaB